MDGTKLKGTLQLRLIYLIFGYSAITPRWGSKPMPQKLYPHLNSIGKHALIKNQNVMNPQSSNHHINQCISEIVLSLIDTNNSNTWYFQMLVYLPRTDYVELRFTTSKPINKDPHIEQVRKLFSR